MAAVNIDQLTGLERPDRSTWNSPAAPATGVFRINLRRFDELNRVHGRKVADEVLAEVGRRLGALVAPDRAFRLGGDQFLVVAEGLDINTAATLGAFIRESLEQPCSGLPLAVTIGACLAHDGLSINELVDRAEECLWAQTPPTDPFLRLFAPSPAPPEGLRRYRVTGTASGDCQPRRHGWAHGSRRDWYVHIPVGTTLAEEYRREFFSMSLSDFSMRGIFGVMRVLDGPLAGQEVDVFLQDEIRGSPPRHDSIPGWLEFAADGAPLEPLCVFDLLAERGLTADSVPGLLDAWERHCEPHRAPTGRDEHYCERPCAADILARMDAGPAAAMQDWIAWRIGSQR